MAAQPNMMELHAMLMEGVALQKAGDLPGAEKLYRSVVAQVPSHHVALHLAATAAAAQQRFEESIALYLRSLALHPLDPAAWNNLAQTYLSIDKVDAAQEATHKSVALAPNLAKGWYLHGVAALGKDDYEKARDSFAKARALPVDMGLEQLLLGVEWDLAQKVCDWKVMAWCEQAMRSSTGAALNPFKALAFDDAPLWHRRCAEAASRDASQAEPSKHQTDGRRAKIRLAYLSSDLYDHATAYLMAELFERHDRSRFEVIAVSWGPSQDSPMQRRLMRAFDQFWDVRGWTVAQIVARMAQAQVDIAVDLKGFTKASRPEIFPRKPASIIVNYLGYPGTMGSNAYDYIIGDATVTPFEHEGYYTEHIVQMPNCYQVNDGQRAIAAEVPTRSQEGLPEQGFVFAAFNNVYKIRPAFFQVWMNLLRQVPGSVLWLICSEPVAQRNLRAEASASGIDPDRLAFARHVPLAQHLARHAHAGVLLDTLPYNAHTTGSDALWAGTPMVTCMGQGFAGRVAASLLRAVGLEELITHNLEAYEALALRIAQDPAYQQHLRAHLKAVRHSTSLFDAGRFAADLEAAYLHMHERWLRGLPPQAFAVADLQRPASH